MAKQSPFYKTGISRSPLNTHHIQEQAPRHSPSPRHSPTPKMIKSKTPIDPGKTQVTYDKKTVEWNSNSNELTVDPVQKVQNKQDLRTQKLIDRKIKKISKKFTKNKKREIKQKGRENRRNIRKNL